MHHPPYVHNTLSLIAHRVIMDTKERDTVAFYFQALSDYGNHVNIHTVYLHTHASSNRFEFLKPIESFDKYTLLEMKDAHADTLERT